MRKGESERNPYIFTDNDTFEKLINNNELIEYREYKSSNGDIWYYGVEIKEIDERKNYVAVLDVVGLEGFIDYFPNNVISIFLDASEQTRRKRCIDRGDYNVKEWFYRLEEDEKMFSDDFINKNIDFVVDAEKSEDDIFNDVLLKINEKQ